MSTLYQVRRILGCSISNRRPILLAILPPSFKGPDRYYAGGPCTLVIPSLDAGGPPLYSWLHKNWHHDPTRPEPWSTDWDKWVMLESWFITTVDGKRGIDRLRDTWALPGPVEPVAYVADQVLYFLIYAGGRHYFWADARLTMHRKVFASHKDFMRWCAVPVGVICRISKYR